MSEAVKCPVCNGAGKLPAKPGVVTTAMPGFVQCHGCFGRGWVAVP